MGRNKLILPWGKTTVFERCLRVLLGSELEEVIVVLGTRSEALDVAIKRYPPLFREKMKVVSNPHSQDGMSTSIRRGLQAVNSKSKGILIALGDQPFLKIGTVNALIHAFVPGKGKIVLPFYGKRGGNPVLFDQYYVDELLNLEGDLGGRSIVDSHPDKVIRVRTRSEGVVKDIDTWEEYEKLKARPSKGGMRPRNEKKTKAQSSKLKAQSSKLKAQSSKLKAQSSKLKAQTNKDLKGYLDENLNVQNQKGKMKAETRERCLNGI